MAPLNRSELGRARQLCPGTSDVDFLSDLDGVVNLDAEVADGALDLGVPEQQLHGAQVAGSPIDQRGLGPAQGVRSELEGIEPDAGNPLTDQAGVLPGGQAAINSAPAGKQELAVAPACNPKMLVDCLPCLLGQFEPHGPSGLLLPNRGPVQGVAVGGDIVDADGHDIATTQLAVNCEIEQSQVAGAALQLQPSPN